MSELAEALTHESYAASPSHILEGLTEDLVHRTTLNATHTIYQELWHLSFWQQITLDWIAGVETPYPENPSAPFTPTTPEPWDHLRQRFLQGAEKAASAARDSSHLDQSISCPSRPGHPVRNMTVRDQLISLAAHNAYHFGRIVLLRQLNQAWPPPSGGFTW